MGLWDDEPDYVDNAQAPICESCGVTALAGEQLGGESFVCENPDCHEFGEPVPSTR